MKVLLISNMYPTKEYPFYGIFVKNIKDAMEAEGIKIFTSTVNGRQKNIFSKIISYILFYTKSIFLGLTKQFDLIYSHNLIYTFIPAIIIKVLRKKKLIIHVHGSDLVSENFLAKIFNKLFYRYLFLIDLWVVPSTYFKNILKKKFNIEEDKIYVYPSGGIDTQLFKKLEDRFLWKKNFGIEKNTFTIGYVSRIDKGKGWDIFLEALKCLKKRGFKFKAIIVGSGKEIKDFKEYINKMDLTSEVIYLGELKQKDLVLAYNAMDVFVFPTQLEESLGLVGIEAMACGVPVIGTKIGGLQDYIIEGKNGFFFKKGNSKELCNKIIMFYNINQKEKEFISNYAIEISKKFDKRITTRNFILKLRSLVNEDFRYS